MTDYKNLKTFKKSQVNGLTKFIASARWTANHDYNDKWSAVINRAESVGMELSYCGPYYGERFDFKKPRKITREQTIFGKQWLKEFFFNKKGEPRKGKRTEGVSDRVLSIAENVSRFELVGVAVLASSGWYPVQAVPIYRTYNKKGEYFDYSPIHWGQPIIDESN